MSTSSGPVRLPLLLAAVVLPWLLPTACGAQTGGASRARFETVECWFQIPSDERATCGYMHVPEKRQAVETRSIRFPVVILHSWSESRRADPLVIPGGGGPGSSIGLSPAQMRYAGETYATVALANGRDVILAEQRGVGRGHPSIACPEINEVARADLGQRWADSLIERYVEASEVCRDRLSASGVDLTAYNSVESAHDLEDLRRSLGISSWNVWGTSYGSRLALTLMREHPGPIRSAVLESLVSPEIDEYADSMTAVANALEDFFLLCEADDFCKTEYPGLRSIFAELWTRLRNEPISLSVSHPKTLEPVPVVIDEMRLTEIVAFAFQSTWAITELPRIITSLHRGSTDLAAPLVRELVASYLGVDFSSGLYYSTTCRDEFPFNDLRRAAKEAERHPRFRASNRAFLRIESKVCKSWGSGTADPVEAKPVASEIPTLILSGGLDASTPTTWARSAASHLSNAHLFVFPGFGHGVFASNYCVDQLIADFLDVPLEEPPRTCAEKFGVKPFIARY